MKLQFLFELVICCVANNLKTQWLKQLFYFAHSFVGQDFGGMVSLVLHCYSQEVAKGWSHLKASSFTKAVITESGRFIGCFLFI